MPPTRFGCSCCVCFPQPASMHPPTLAGWGWGGGRVLGWMLLIMFQCDIQHSKRCNQGPERTVFGDESLNVIQKNCHPDSGGLCFLLVRSIIFAHYGHQV